MTIGFSPFLTADVDDTWGLTTQWSPPSANPQEEISSRRGSS